MPLGDSFKPVHLSNACNIAGTFILTTLTNPHVHRLWRQLHFYSPFVLTRTFGVSSVLLTAHSHHRQFIDPRHIGYIAHLWETFVSQGFALGYSHWISVTLCRLPRALKPFASLRLQTACRSLRVGISGRYPIILPIEISVL